jgi:hypothetical protein
MNTKKIGDVSEAKILARFLERGYTVLEPRGDNERYDLVVEIGGSFVTVQVKTGRLTDDRTCLIFSCKSNNWYSKTNSSYQEDVDLFAVYSPDTKKCYLIPIGDIGTASMRLRLVEGKRKSSLINWTDDYTF